MCQSLIKLYSKTLSRQPQMKINVSKIISIELISQKQKLCGVCNAIIPSSFPRNRKSLKQKLKTVSRKLSVFPMIPHTKIKHITSPAKRV